MATAMQKMEKAYKGSWGQLGPNRANCSGFLKALQDEFGFTVPDYEADVIIGWLDGEASRAAFKAGAFGAGEWTKLPVGDWHAALREATRGRFVLAALKSHEYKPKTRHGHVAVVLPRTGGPYGEPVMYGGGDAAATSPGTKYLGLVWDRAYHGRIRYYVHATASIGQYDRE